MKLYYIEGTCRQLGALGIFEPFNAEVRANSYDEALNSLYETREHIHIYYWTEWTNGERTGGASR